MTSSIDFARLRHDYVQSQQQEPKEQIWYVYAAVIIESVAPPSHIAELWKYLTTLCNDHDDLVFVARRLREGLLKASPLAGFPKASPSLILS
jgi:hypothetical protein